MVLASVFHVVRSFLQAEVENVRQHDIPWRRRLWLYSNGFLSSKDAIWNLSPETKTDYLSDLQGLDSKLVRIDHPYDDVLHNKIHFHLIVSASHDELLPDVHGLVRQGRVMSPVQFGSLESFEDLVDRLSETPVVAKPTRAAQGDGVRVLDERNGQLYCNDRKVTREELARELDTDRELILQEYLTQADYAADIYPEATNTVRILTVVDPETGEPIVAGAMHRFGTSASGTVDNASSGGITAGIDPDTGEMGEVLVPPKHESGADRWTKTHPDTGSPIAGTTIPAWNRVRDQVLDLAADYGWMWPQVAWDVIVRDDRGKIAILEGNENPGTEYIQAHQPLLADERVRRFYEYHDVVSPLDKRTWTRVGNG